MLPVFAAAILSATARLFLFVSDVCVEWEPLIFCKPYGRSSAIPKLSDNLVVHPIYISNSHWKEPPGAVCLQVFVDPAKPLSIHEVKARAWVALLIGDDVFDHGLCALENEEPVGRRYSWEDNQRCWKH